MMGDESELLKLPDCCTVDIVTYVTSDSTGLEAAIAIRNLPAFVMPTGDHSKILEQLPPVADDWRVMTRSEVSDYLKRQREDEESEVEF